MVGDDGNTYLTGLNAKDTLQVRWDDQVQCEITLLIPCQKMIIYRQAGYYRATNREQKPHRQRP